MRVLDLTLGRLETATDYLAELGAQVVRVNDHRASTGNGHCDPTLRDAINNRRKSHIELDLANTAGQDELLVLARSVDVVIEAAAAPDYQPVQLASRYGQIAASAPQVVLVTVSDFGMSGPYRSWVGTEWTHYAMAGPLSRSGRPGERPVLAPRFIGVGTAAMHTAWVAMLAYLNAFRTGIGEHVDLSMYEIMAYSFDPGWGSAGSGAVGGDPATLPRGRTSSESYPIARCLDGFVRVTALTPRQWIAMRAWLGNPEELMAPEFEILWERLAAYETVNAYIRCRVQNLTCQEAIDSATSAGVPVAPVLTHRDVIDAPHFVARDAIESVELEDGRQIRIPRGTYQWNGRWPRWSDRPETFMTTTAPGRDRPAPDESATAPSTPRRPLADLRVLDMTKVVAGGEIGRLLSDQGAFVLRIEDSDFPDQLRQTPPGLPMTEAFARLHRSQQSLNLSIKAPAALKLLHKLAGQFDVLIANFKPGTLEQLGLDYESLRHINPRIVVAETNAFGDGPWRRNLGYGPLVRSCTGVSYTWRDPLFTGPDFFPCDASSIYPDHITGMAVALAIVASVMQARKTGVGCNVSVAQTDVVLGHMREILGQVSLVPITDEADDQTLNFDTKDAAQDVFPCAGDDEWCVVDIQADGEWQRLCKVIDRVDLAVGSEYATAKARCDRKEELNKAIARWTRLRTAREVVEILQRERVPCGFMQRVSDMPSDPQLRARNFFTVLNQTGFDAPLVSLGGPAHFANIAEPLMTPAPVEGEQTLEICRTLLRLSESQIDDLIEHGVIRQPETEGAEHVV